MIYHLQCTDVDGNPFHHSHSVPFIVQHPCRPAISPIPHPKRLQSVEAVTAAAATSAEMGAAAMETVAAGMAVEAAKESRPAAERIKTPLRNRDNKNQDKSNSMSISVSQQSLSSQASVYSSPLPPNSLLLSSSTIPSFSLSHSISLSPLPSQVPTKSYIQRPSLPSLKSATIQRLINFSSSSKLNFWISSFKNNTKNSSPLDLRKPSLPLPPPWWISMQLVGPVFPLPRLRLEQVNTWWGRTELFSLR